MTAWRRPISGLTRIVTPFSPRSAAALVATVLAPLAAVRRTPAAALLALGIGLNLGVGDNAWAQSPPTTEQDQVVLDLREAYRNRQTRPFETQLPRLRGHLLEPLAAYWDMKLRLDTATPEAVADFLNRWSGSYYEDRLRNDWLLVLGQRRAWEALLAEVPRYRMNDDRQVRCHTLHAQHAVRQPLLAAEAQEAARLWLGQREAEDACTAVVKRLLDDQRLDAQVAWQRARLGAELNRPRVTSQAVELLNPEWLPALSRIQAQPAQYLDGKLTAVRHRTKELVTLALVRLAATSPADAAEQMEKARWRVQLTAEERSWVWGVIGRTAAQRLMPEATGWFAQGQAEFMHPDHLSWWARAALRNGQWNQVSQVIATLPDSERRSPTWRYWEARALEATSTPDAANRARQLYQGLAGPQGFYPQLAQEALGQAITAPARPAPLTPEEQQRAANNPGLQRALWAISLGLRSEGVREWNYSTNLHTPGGLPERDLLAAAELACRHAVWDRCINTSERTNGVVDQAQRFPTPHREAVVRQAQAAGLDPAYVYGLIRQESRFVTDARSHVGASGLMQIMPATARWTAKKIGLTHFKPQQVTELDTNLSLGTGYLKLVLDGFEGSKPLATAAYNAGPGRPRNWRAPGGTGPVLDAAIWIENIPFTETRDYVKAVLANTVNYAALLTGQPQSLRERLGRVGPRTTAEPPEERDLP